MSDLISREAVIRAIDSFDVFDGYQDKVELKSMIERLPAVDAVSISELYDAGYQGKEVRFYVRGRLFAVREVPQ